MNEQGLIVKRGCDFVLIVNTAAVVFEGKFVNRMFSDLTFKFKC